MVQIETLPNGVRLVTEAMDTVRSAALGIWVGGGSREETPEESWTEDSTEKEARPDRHHGKKPGKPDRKHGKDASEPRPPKH